MKHVVIGAGAAGLTAAQTIREMDSNAAITVVSVDEQVHSRCMLHKYLGHERDAVSLNFVGKTFFEDQRIGWLKGKRLQTIDPRAHSLTLDDDTVVPYDKLLIATGADSVIPPIGGFRTASNVFGLRNLSDAQAIDRWLEEGSSEVKSRVLVVGSGLVGLDAAYALLERGFPVQIVELDDHILPMQLDAVAAGTYQNMFRAIGGEFFIGHRAVDTEVDGGGRVRSVLLDDGTRLICDLVVVAAGVRPAVADLAESGMAIERGIVTDAHMRTNLPDIYAAGDVTALSGTWPNARIQGKVAAMNMCGVEMEYEDTYCLKNTIHFRGLPTLSLGKWQEQPGDKVYTRESRTSYQRIILNDGKVRSVIIQGDLRYVGFWQYLIKHQIDVSACGEKPFKLSFADFYGMTTNGQYAYQRAE